MFETVISECLGSTHNNKNDNNEIKKENSLFNALKGKDTLPTLVNNNSSSLNDSFIIEIKASSLNNNNGSGLETINSKASNHSISNNDENTLITNDNHNTLPTADKPNTSESSISKRIKDDSLLEEILKSVPETIPIVLIDVINDYSKYHDDTINEYYDRIKNKLMTIIGKVVLLDLYDPNFISNLLKLTKDKMEEIPDDAPF